jgi:hypothetical protein
MKVNRTALHAGGFLVATLPFSTPKDLSSNSTKTVLSPRRIRGAIVLHLVHVPRDKQEASKPSCLCCTLGAQSLLFRRRIHSDCLQVSPDNATKNTHPSSVGKQRKTIIPLLRQNMECTCPSHHNLSSYTTTIKKPSPEISTFDTQAY